MVWTVPKTAVDGETLTAAEYNQYIRDNMLETHAAKATSANRGAMFCATGANEGAERRPVEDFITTQQQRSSASYGDLSTVGPTVTCTTGERAMVFLYAAFSNSSSIQSSYMSYAVSGDTTQAASDDTALRRQGANNIAAMSMHLNLDLNPGSNTFTAKYRVAANTGDWWNRRIIVIPF